MEWNLQGHTTWQGQIQDQTPDFFSMISSPEFLNSWIPLQDSISESTFRKSLYFLMLFFPNWTIGKLYSSGVGGLRNKNKALRRIRTSPWNRSLPSRFIHASGNLWHQEPTDNKQWEQFISQTVSGTQDNQGFKCFLLAAAFFHWDTFQNSVSTSEDHSSLPF